MSNRFLSQALLFAFTAIFFLTFLFPVRQIQAWYADQSWAYRKSILIDHTKVIGSTDLTNFPVLVSLTDSNLRHTSSGGRVGKTDGTDILVTSSDGSTKLDHEIEFYSPTSGQLIMWVRVPTLSTSVNTQAYIYYGNSGAIDQQNPTGAWNSNYKGVWHLSEGDSTSPSFYKDSTTNNRDGTLTDTDGDSAQITGQIGSGVDFAADADYIDAGIINELASSTSATLSGWVYRESTGDSVGFGMYGKPSWWGRFNITWQNDSNIYNQAENQDVPFGSSYPNFSAPVSGWHHIAMAYDGGQTGLNRLQVYFDGVLQTLSPGNIDPASSLPGLHNLSAFRLGVDMNDGIDRFWGGAIDEARITNNTLSSDWIITEFNNQSSPSAFYNVGSEESFDTVAPVLSSVTSGSLTSSSAVITWSSNEAATSQVEYGLTSTLSASSSLSSSLVTSHSVTLSSLNPSTTYYYRVLSSDTVGNRAYSTILNFTTSAASSGGGGGGGGGSYIDNISPSISIISPASGSGVSGNVIISVNVSDNVMVSGVLYKVDGVSVGPEINISPFSITLNTVNLTNGSHIILAIARDSSGNTSNSLPISLNILNYPNSNSSTASSTNSSTSSSSTVQSYGFNGLQMPSLVEIVYPYVSRTLVNDKGTIYFIAGKIKIPFVSMEAFKGFGFNLKNVVIGDTSVYKLPQSYLVSTHKAQHPWDTVLTYAGKLYYAHESGMIPVPSKTILTKNGISQPYVLNMNSYDVKILKAQKSVKPLVENDTRIQK